MDMTIKMMIMIIVTMIKKMMIAYIAEADPDHFEIAWQRKIDRPAKDILYFYIL